MLVLKLPRQTRAPANAAVCTRHVRYRRSGLSGFEPVRLRDHVGDLVSAPTVPLNSDVVLIDESFIDYGLNCRQHALQSTAPRIARGVDDVRHEDQIAVADIESRIDRSARRGIPKCMQALRQP